MLTALQRSHVVQPFSHPPLRADLGSCQAKAEVVVGRDKMHGG